MRDGCSGGIPRRAQVDDLARVPYGVWHSGEIRLVVVSSIAVDVVGHAVAEQGCSLVDLVEGVRHQHPRCGLAAECRLAEGEQRFPSAGNGQNLSVRVEPNAETPRQPSADGLAQLRDTSRGRVSAQTGPEPAGIAQHLDHKLRRVVLGLADGERDVREVGGAPDAGQELSKPLEGISLQFVQVWVHLGSGCRDLAVQTLPEGVFQQVDGFLVGDRLSLPAADLEHVLDPFAKGGDPGAVDYQP